MVFRRLIPTVLPAMLLAGWMLFAGCQSVPVTGRNQLNLVSDKEVVKASKAEFQKIKNRSRISRDPAKIARVQDITDRIIQQVNWWDVPNAEWETIVIENPREVNAFAMAGGKIGVYTGLIDLVDNDDQLAFVIAHELAHITARHVHERLSQEMVREAGGVALSAASITQGGVTLSAVNSLYGLSSGVASLSFNRAKEAEADTIGLMYMARAGYDPRQALEIINKVSQSGSAHPGSEWLSTHPSYATRLSRIQEDLPDAVAAYQQATGRSLPDTAGNVIGD
ncbi:MAG: M48 family metallopeptidase [Opitutales bacterium]